MAMSRGAATAATIGLVSLLGIGIGPCRQAGNQYIDYATYNSGCNYGIGPGTNYENVLGAAFLGSLVGLLYLGLRGGLTERRDREE